MFDLFRSRDKAVRILLGGLLLVVAFSMLSYLVPTYDTGGGATGTVVATVGNQKIMMTDVQRQVQSMMRGRQLPPEILPNYIPQIVDQMVTERAVQYEADRLGFEVSDDYMRQNIQQIYGKTLYPDGRFIGKDAYEALLAQQGTNSTEFEANLRRQIIYARLRDVAVEGTIVTPMEIEQAFKQKNEKVKLGYVKLISDKYKSEVTPNEAEMRSYYTANIASYQTAEKKNLVLLVADQAKLEQTITASDADLQKAYNQNPEQFRVPEQVKVQHILFMTQGKPPADDAKIKAQAEDAIKQLKAGAVFKDLVQKLSEDPGKAQNNGEYTVRRDGTMDPDFEKAAFSQKVGDYGIVKTAYGYHVVQVVKHDEPHLQTFAEVKDTLASAWKKAQVNQILQSISDKAQINLQKDPMHPEAVAAQLHMDVVHADNYEPGKPIANVGSGPDLDQAIGPLKQGQVSQPVSVSGGKIAVAEVVSVVAPRPSTFDEVQSKIKDSMTTARLASAVRKHAQELADKAKSMGGDLEKAAKSMGLEYKVSDAFTRTDTINGFGSANYVQQAFTAANGAVIGPVMMPDATVIAKVLEHQPPDMSKLAADRTQIRDQIKSKKAQDRDALFEAGLRDQLIKEGKIKINQDVLNRLISSYRT